jgi:hypothetical protein
VVALYAAADGVPVAVRPVVEFHAVSMLFEPEPVRVLFWIQTPFTAKHPLVRFQPFAPVLVPEVTLSAVVWIPAEKVEVAVVVETVRTPLRATLPWLFTLKTVVDALLVISKRRVDEPTGSPQIVSLDDGDEVPIARRVPVKTKDDEVAQVFAAEV